MSETSTPDPKSLYGNPQRIAPKISAGQYGPNPVLLDMDEAFEDGQPEPPSLPHGPAGPKTQADAAAYQEWADWGAIQQVINIRHAGQEPDDTQLRRIAYNCGVSFSYQGHEYYNATDGGTWIPG